MEASPHRPLHEDAHTTSQSLIRPPPQQQESARKARSERPAASLRSTPPASLRHTGYDRYASRPRTPSPPSPRRTSSPRRYPRSTDALLPSPSNSEFLRRNPRPPPYALPREALEGRRGIFYGSTTPASPSIAQPILLKRKAKRSNLTKPSRRLALSPVLHADDEEDLTPSTNDAAPLPSDYLLSPVQSSTGSTAQTTTATIHRTIPPPLVAGQYQEVEQPSTGEEDAAGSMADSRQERELDIDSAAEEEVTGSNDEDAELHLNDGDAKLHQEVDPAAEEETTGLDDEDAGLHQKEDPVVEQNADLAENADRDFHQGKRSVAKPDTSLNDEDAALHQEANSLRRNFVRGKESGLFQVSSRVASANQAEAIAALGEESSRYFLADISAASNLGAAKRTMSEDFQRKRSKFERNHELTQRAQSLDSGTIHPQQQSKIHRDIPLSDERGKNHGITLTLVECLVICLCVMDVLGSIVSRNLYLPGCFSHRHQFIHRFYGRSGTVKHEESVFSTPVAGFVPITMTTATTDGINYIRSPWSSISVQEPSSIGTMELAQRLNTVMSTHRGLLKKQHQV
ncbi:unnamed protein product [Zymoseptoria tritici ST99CH_3D1]|nr:unnamed protein product [Zymoseptoria tritici ST99CH_3D1]